MVTTTGTPSEDRAVKVDVGERPDRARWSALPSKAECRLDDVLARLLQAEPGINSTSSSTSVLTGARLSSTSLGVLDQYPSTALLPLASHQDITPISPSSLEYCIHIIL